MPTRVTPTTTSRTPKSAVLHLLERKAARRRARQQEQQLALALAGEFGPGVQSDVIAAQARWTQDRTAA